MADAAKKFKALCVQLKNDITNVADFNEKSEIFFKNLRMRDH